LNKDNIECSADKIENLIGFSEYSPSAKALDAAFKCKQLNLAAFQLSGDFSVNFPENISESERLQVREYIRDNNIHLHYHAPSDIPLASRHEKIRLGGVQRLQEYIELAIDMGADSFVFHPGRFAYYMIGSRKIVIAKKNVPQSYFDRFYDSVSRMAVFADRKIYLLLENTYDFNDQAVDVIDRFLKIPFTGIVWDIGYMHSRSLSDKTVKNRIASFFSDRLKYIKLAHIHDAAGGKSHLPLGAGSLDIVSFIDIFNSLNIEMIIEVYSEKDLKASLEYIKLLNVNKL